MPAIRPVSPAAVNIVLPTARASRERRHRVRPGLDLRADRVILVRGKREPLPREGDLTKTRRPDRDTDLGCGVGGADMHHLDMVIDTSAT